MRTFALACVLVLAPLIGCSKADRSAAQAPSIPEVTVDAVDQLLAKQEGQAVDANGDATRRKLGIIPGAVLLTDSETYLPSELPADKSKPLVFYCTNTHCGASHQAAEKALTAGYKNVKVMPEGIAGWVKAGKPTAKVGS